MSERDTTEPIDIIDVEQSVPESGIELEATHPAEPDEPGNPDGWLQWALIIGLLALFLICAFLILVGWNNR